MIEVELGCWLYSVRGLDGERKEVQLREKAKVRDKVRHVVGRVPSMSAESERTTLKGKRTEGVKSSDLLNEGMKTGEGDVDALDDQLLQMGKGSEDSHSLLKS
jgi:hypothetical protein